MELLAKNRIWVLSETKLYSFQKGKSGYFLKIVTDLQILHTYHTTEVRRVQRLISIM